MPRANRLLIFACAFAASASSGGCCLWRNFNPVSESLVESRQLTQQGADALRQRDLPEAERLCAQAVRSCPDDAAARRNYADVLWEQGRRDSALEQLDAALATAPDDPQLRLRSAEMRLHLRQFAAADADALRAIDINPKSPAAWALRGRIQIGLDNPRQALADFQRSLSYDARQRDVLRQTAELYQRLGEPHRALAVLQALSDTYGPNEEPAEVLKAEALAYAALGRNVDAAETLRRACRREPPSSDLLMLLAQAESAAGQTTLAHYSAQQALALAPTDPRCHELVQRTAAAMPTVDDDAQRR